MKINEYAANVSEYTEVVDAPYNHKGGEEVLDERPMGIVKGGLQKLGAKLLPGSYGSRMQGKVETGQQANQLYKEFNVFLGKKGFESTDDAIKAFLKQKGINVNIDDIIKKVAPAPAAPPLAPAPAPVAESIDQLNRILILSGRAPKNVLNETKIVKKKVLTEAVALNRGALNKIFMQVAQQMPDPTGGAEPAAGGAPAAPASGGGGAPAPAAPRSAAPAPKAPAGGSDFGGNGPAAAPAPNSPASSGEPAAEPAAPNAPPVQPPAPPPAAEPAPTKPSIGSRMTGAAKTAAGAVGAAASKGVQAVKGAVANRKQQAAPPAPAPTAAAEPAADAAPVSNPPAAEPITTDKKQPSQNPEAIRSAKRRAAEKEKAAAAQGQSGQQTEPTKTKPRVSVRAATNKPRVSVRAATNAPPAAAPATSPASAASPNILSMGGKATASNYTGGPGQKPYYSTVGERTKEKTNEDIELKRLLSKISMRF